MQLNRLLEKAKTSAIHRHLLNYGLRRMIPFNGAHHLKIEQVMDHTLLLTLPSICQNKNHLQGMHACALATLCEYISGLSLARVLPAEEYRLILKSIHVEYLYQARKKVFARYGIGETEADEIRQVLKAGEALLRTCQVEVEDEDKNIICRGEITWQIKAWTQVKSSR